MDSLLKLDVPLAELMPVLREFLDVGKNVKISPQGISMLPMIRQGIDKVVLSPISGELRKYDLPLYQRDDGHFVLHRIVKTGETYTCIGDNQFELEHGLRHDQMIAVVTAFYRGDKLHSVNELGYQIYCRFWHYSRRILRRRQSRHVAFSSRCKAPSAMDAAE